MGTTVWIDDATRADLRRLQDAFGTPSVNATIQRLLSQPAMDARTIFAKHGGAIAAILKRHGLRGLVAFGSRARGEARPDSDLDLAAHIDPRGDPLAIFGAELDFEDLLGMKVHIVQLPNQRLAATLKRDGIAFAG
ncbi:MAG: nucleotidyltransferase domain-containing protein [Candidatus Thermoplasmatota archaeon]